MTLDELRSFVSQDKIFNVPERRVLIGIIDYLGSLSPPVIVSTDDGNELTIGGDGGAFYAVPPEA